MVLRHQYLPHGRTQCNGVTSSEGEETGREEIPLMEMEHSGEHRETEEEDEGVGDVHESSVYDTCVCNHNALISGDVTTCDVTIRNGHVQSSPGDVIIPPSSGSKHSICSLSRDGFKTYTRVYDYDTP